ETVAGNRTIPVATTDTRLKHAVEQVRACRAQKQAAARVCQACRTIGGEPAPRFVEIAGIATETLVAERVGHALRHDPLEHRLGRVDIALHIAQHDRETVAAMRAALQFSAVPAASQYAHAFDDR